jgi:hypothetical protein
LSTNASPELTPKKLHENRNALMTTTLPAEHAGHYQGSLDAESPPPFAGCRRADSGRAVLAAGRASTARPLSQQPWTPSARADGVDGMNPG